MAEISKQALKTENQSSFPNNTSGLITPTILRNFNNDMIDSLVDEITFNAFSSSVTQSIQALQSFSSSLDTNFASQAEFNSFTQSADGRLDSLELATSSYANSASVAAVDAAQQLQINSLIAATASFVSEAESGSFLVTASFDNNSRDLTFTKGNASTFVVNIPASSGSASLPSGVVSGSSQIDYPLISNIPAGIVSGSSQLTASYDTRYTLSGSVQPLPSGVVSGSSQIILQSTTGNLSGSRIDGTVLSATSASYSVISDTALVAGKAQDLYVNCKNTTTAIIPKGAVVRITGASGDNPEIGLADWTNDLNSANTLGITSEAVAVNGFTDVIVQGKMIGLNTAAFTPGQLVFLGASGSIVASVPPQYHEVRLGQVLRANTNVGSLYLSVDNGYELTELHDVNIVTASLANNDLLAYDSTSQQWTNKTITAVGAATTGSNTFTGNQTINGFLTASLQQGYVWVGNASGQTTTVPTSSFGGGGSAFPYTGNAQITGSLSIKGTGGAVPVLFNIDTSAGGLGDLTFSGNDANFTVQSGDLKVNTDTVNRGIQIQGPDPTIGLRDTTSPLNPYIAIQNKDRSFQIFDQIGTIATFNTASIQLLSATSISGSLNTSGSITIRKSGGEFIVSNIDNPEYGVVSLGMSNASQGGIQFKQSGSVIIEGAPSDGRITFYATGSFGKGIQMGAPESYSNNLFIYQSGSRMVAGGPYEGLFSDTLVFGQRNSGTTTQFTNVGVQIDKDLTLIGGLTASMQEGYVWVGNGAGVSQLTPTSSFAINTTQFATTGSNTFNGNQTINGALSASADIYGQTLRIPDSLYGGNIRFLTGSEYFNIQLIPNDGDLAFSRGGVANTKVMTLGGKSGGFTTFQNNAVQFQSTIGSAQFDAPVVINSGINSSVQITGSLTITPSSVSTNAGYPIPFLSSNTFAKDSVDTLMYNPSTNQLYVSASTGQSIITPNAINFTSGSGQYGTYAAAISKTGYVHTVEGGNYIAMMANPSKTGAPSLTSNTKPAILGLSGSGVPYVAIELQQSGSGGLTDGRVTIKRPLVLEQPITGSATINGNTTINANLVANKVSCYDFDSLFYGSQMGGTTANGTFFGYGSTDYTATIGAYGGAFDNELQTYVDSTGIYLKDFNGGGYSTFLKLLPNAGSNPKPIMTRGLEITGSFNANIPTASAESQINLFNFAPFLSNNGTTYTLANISLQDYASSAIDQTFTVEYASADYTKYLGLIVGPTTSGQRAGFTLNNGGDYNFDEITLNDNGSTTTAVLKADKVDIQSVLQLKDWAGSLPTGASGQLAVSNGNLYYHNGTSWSQLN